MKISTQLFFTLFICLLFSNCSLITNSLKYQNTAKEFSYNLIHAEYDKCIRLMATENFEVNKDTLKSELKNFHDLIIENFGTKLDFTFMTAEKNGRLIKKKAHLPTLQKF